MHDSDSPTFLIIVARAIQGLLLPTATLLPSTSYLETMRESLDFLFSPVYLQLTSVLKALLICVRVVVGRRRVEPDDLEKHSYSIYLLSIIVLPF